MMLTGITDNQLLHFIQLSNQLVTGALRSRGIIPPNANLTIEPPTVTPLPENIIEQLEEKKVNIEESQVTVEDISYNECDETVIQIDDEEKKDNESLFNPEVQNSLSQLASRFHPFVQEIIPSNDEPIIVRRNPNRSSLRERILNNRISNTDPIDETDSFNDESAHVESHTSQGAGRFHPIYRRITPPNIRSDVSIQRDIDNINERISNPTRRVLETDHTIPRGFTSEIEEERPRRVRQSSYDYETTIEDTLRHRTPRRVRHDEEDDGPKEDKSKNIHIHIHMSR